MSRPVLTDRVPDSAAERLERPVALLPGVTTGAVGVTVASELLADLRATGQCLRVVTRAGAQWRLRCLTHGWWGPLEDSCDVAGLDTCAVAAGAIESDLRARAAALFSGGGQ